MSSTLLASMNNPMMNPQVSPYVLKLIEEAVRDTQTLGPASKALKDDVAFICDRSPDVVNNLVRFVKAYQDDDEKLGRMLAIILALGIRVGRTMDAEPETR